jgi:hypothetical protein
MFRVAELMNTKRPPAIMIGVPSPGFWKAKMGVDTLSMALWAAYHGIYIEARGAEGAYTEANRNNIVRAALDYKHPIDAIMWIDADMRVLPQTLLRLWKYGRDIVGANYREREPPYSHLGKFSNERDAKAKGGIHEMDLMPGGMILVRTAVYRKLSAPWYKLDDDGLRDDYYFCTKAREAGYKVWCDMELTRTVRHRGDNDVWWYGEGEEPVARADPRQPVFDIPSLVGRAGLENGAAFPAPEKVAS